MSFRPINNQTLKALIIDPSPPPKFNRAQLPVGNILLNGRPTGFRCFIQRCNRQLTMGELVEVCVVRVDRDGKWCFADYLESKP